MKRSKKARERFERKEFAEKGLLRCVERNNLTIQNMMLGFQVEKQRTLHPGSTKRERNDSQSGCGRGRVQKSSAAALELLWTNSSLSLSFSFLFDRTILLSQTLDRHSHKTKESVLGKTQTNDVAWVTLGRAQLNFGEPDNAIESFDRALALKVA
ncbi:hypothetical protein JHK84_043054 [Glycine max]|nr:hypothetical protein JHK84_043054 [Glycine max]